MLILLPPSEGKTLPATAPFQLEGISWPELHPTRTRLINALDAVLNSPPALASLKLTGAAAREFPRNQGLLQARTGPAHEVYTGVLFQALGYADLPDWGRRRAAAHVAIASALWGLVRLTDNIPAYRLSAGMKLPRVGGLTSLWRAALGPVLDVQIEHTLTLDCRSGPYVAMWKPHGETRRNWFPVRVFQERGGKRTVVSHHAKQARGLLVRHFLHQQDPLPTSADELLERTADFSGFTVEITQNEKAGASTPLHTLDLVSRA